MKDLREITSCVVDYGTFIGVAEAMAKHCAKSLYYSPFEEEYLDIKKCCQGDGLPGVTRVDDPLDPDTLKDIDLFIFPDIGFGGLQRHLRSLGKAVWGSMGASDLELYRTRFLRTLKEVGLPVAPSLPIKGLTQLAEHLKGVKDKWIKVNRYRANMETWHHQDYAHSQNKLADLAMQFGPLRDRVWFVVQDSIPDALEIGYDGFSVDGQFPARSYQGYEAKNKLYLGSELAAADLPEEVICVNEAMAPVLAEYGYRNFWATEIRRVVGGKAYFIDPTARMAGQTMEHQLLSMDNFGEVIWKGAQGELVTPEFIAPFAAEATLHYTASDPEAWKSLRLPDEVREHVKLYHFCECDGLCHFPPARNDEVGVVIGLGDSVEQAIDDLKEHFEALSEEPLAIDLADFAKLLSQIEEAQSEGLEFSDQPLPEPTIAVEG